MSMVKRRWPAFFFGVTVLIFFWPYFLLDQTLYTGDTAFALMPLRHYATARLAMGELPLWNPNLFGGTPALAESSFQVLYPPNILLLLLGVPRGMGWLLPLHLFLMALGTYLFARYSLGFSRLGATVSATAFTFGGFTIGGLGIPIYTEAAAWLPWIILAYDLAVRRGGVWGVLPALMLAMPLLTGGLFYVYLAVLLLMSFHCYRLWEAGVLFKPFAPPARRAWLSLISGVTFAVLLSAPQLLPQWEIAKLSDRSTHASYEYAVSGSLLPWHFFSSMMLPKLWGLFSGATLEGFMPSAQLGYLGVVSLGLIAAGVAVRPRRFFWFWFAIGLLSLTLAFGRYNPLYPFLYEWVPGFAMFRGPTRWLLLTGFAGALLAGRGCDAIRHIDARIAKKAKTYGLLALAVIFAASSAILLSPLGSTAFTSPQTPFGPWGQVTLIALSAALLALFAWKGARPIALEGGGVATGKHRAIAGMLLVLLVVDLWAVAQDMELNKTLSAAALEQTPAVVAVVNAASPPERFWTEAPPIPMEPWQAGQNLSRLEEMEFRARSVVAIRSLMPSCIAAEMGTMGTTGAWGSLMPLRRHAKPLFASESSALTRQRWRHLMNVRHILTLEPLPETFGEPSTLKRLPLEWPMVYSDSSALPRAWWVGHVREVTGEAAVATISNGTFDPRREVLLETGVVDPGKNAPGTAPVDGSALNAGSVSFSNYKPQQIELQVTAPAKGHVVLMDTFVPGWRAYVDRKPTPVYPANWVGRAVPVAAGNHRIVFCYEPVTVRIGFFLSLLALGALATWAVAAMGTSHAKE